MIYNEYMRFDEKKLGPPLLDQSPTTQKRIAGATADLRMGNIKTPDFDRRPTIIDIPGINSESTEEDLLAWVEGETGFSREIINGGSQESKTAYRKLNAAYQQAKVFLKNILKYDEKEIQVTEPGSLSSKEDLLKLLKNIKLVKGDTGTLSQSIKYCRLLRTAVTTFEATKHDAKMLEKITETLEDSIISKEGENTPLTFAGNHEYGGVESLPQEAVGVQEHYPQ